jgi:5'-3' exonuclease
MLKHHSNCIKTVRTDSSLPDNNIPIDTLALDLNGIFHPAAQKIFKYGAHAPKLQRLLTRNRVPNQKNVQKLRLACFQEVCAMIEELVDKVQPQKRLLLCVDGPAGAGKCSQQRSRRFKSAKERTEKEEKDGITCTFDSCSITPGTKFIHHLTKYIDWYVRHKIQNGDWKHLDILFSSEKVPGEGEHCAISLFRKYCDPSERMMIYGLDADLIMLCLSTGLSNIYVYRDNMYNSSERYVVDIGLMAENIKEALGTKSAVTDFIFMCFMVGNDFLPQIPGLEILNNGIAIILNVYKEICAPYGLIKTDDYTIRLNTFFKFCKKLSELELDALKHKYTIRKKYKEDDLLEDHFRYSNVFETVENNQVEKVVECDFIGYKKAYYAKKLDIHTSEEINTLCQEYIKGLQWVITYYCEGIPSWNWYFPYNYAPLLDDLYRCSGYVYCPYLPSKPLEPFEQLLAVLPPQSNQLLPKPLRSVMISKASPLCIYYPETIEVDVSGKRAEWEGIAQLPIMDLQLLRRTYKEMSKYIPKSDIFLNRREKTIRYIRADTPELWKSYYGDIRNCRVKYEIV